ncbi:MAG TPA: hypothetical protein VF598_09250 [Hymenobacter sp.]
MPSGILLLYPLTEGQVCSANYFGRRGCQQTYLLNEKGGEQTIRFVIESWWLTDLGLVVSELTQF